MPASKLVVGGLSLLLVGQIGFMVYRSARQRDWVRRINGAARELRISDVRSSGEGSLREAILASGSCVLVVAVDPTCAVCQRMRSTWSRRFYKWEALTQHQVRPIWLSIADSASSLAFFTGHELSGSTQAYVAGSPALAARQLELIATPTSYIFSSGARLRGRIVGDFLPAVDSVRRWCS